MIELSEVGSECVMGQEPFIAHGVRGYAILRDDGFVNIPLIVAEHQGSGDVGRFLDSLVHGLHRIPCVTSKRLEGMLKRRGWIPIFEECEYGGMAQSVEVWI